jgi:membrane protein EpsK
MANQLLGTKAGGEYGSLSILPSTFRIFVISIMSVISPIQMKNYALDEFDSLRKISTYSVRMLSIFSALGVGTICGFSKSILRVWLGNEFVHLWLLLIILMVPLFLTLPFQPLYQLQVAYKKVKFPAIATFAAGILNILLIFNFTKTLHMGVEGIGIACGLAFSLRTVLFSSIYGAFIQNLHWTNYIKEILPSIPLIIVSYGISHILTAFYQISNLLTLLLSMGFVLSITFLLGYLLIYKKEIKMLKDFVISKGLSVEI